MTGAGGVSDRTVLIAGATSASGLAATRALIAAGARVIAAGRDPERLDALAALGAQTAVIDLASEQAVLGLAERARIDGLLHLVGGWRAGRSEDSYRALETSFTALRNVTRAFDAQLRSSAAGRLAIVSSTAVARPLAGGASYAAVKAASEAWTRAMAQGFAKSARESGDPLRAAAVVFRVKSLAGLEDRLADAFVALWGAEAADLNDSIIELHEERTA